MKYAFSYGKSDINDWNVEQFGLTSQLTGLTAQEIKSLWIQADIDGNGVVDHEEFQVYFPSVSLNHSLNDFQA